MNLFNLLCVDGPDQNGIFLIMMILPILFSVLFCNGIINIVKNILKRKTDAYANKKYKRGINSLTCSLIILAFVFVIIILNKGSLQDPCGNKSAAFSIMGSITRITQILVPLWFMILVILKIIKLVIKKNKLLKKEIIADFVIALIIFLIFSLFGVIFGIVFPIDSESSSWAQCWCS